MTLLEGDREKIEEGIKEGRIEVAIKLLDILDDKTISEKIGLSLKNSFVILTVYYNYSISSGDSHFFNVH